MAALTTSHALASTAFVSAAVNAVPERGVEIRSSAVHDARLKRLEALSSRKLTRLTALSSRKLVRRSGNGSGNWSRRNVGLVRSQGVAGAAEPAVLEDIEGGDPVHKVLIVGAGIAGLSAAVALHRVGVKVKVLEQSSSMRASGTSLSLFGNAWRALAYLGVADGLREKFALASGISLYDRDDKLLRNFKFSECPGGPHEVRGVERKRLAEALAAQLPPGTIQLNSRVSAIRREPGQGITKVELEDGGVISTKILVGCDGANSVVARWMGLPPTRYVGQLAIRGVAEYSNGHSFGDGIVQYLGMGQRCGIFPFSDSKVYWFYVWNSPSPGPKVTDRNLIKAEALKGVEGWPDKMKELVENTPIESMARSALSDRFNIPGVTPALFQEGITLAGDAMHPMTPNLGQGGGTAIEDGVVLAKTLGVALSEDGDTETIQKALEEYTAQRQERTLPMTIKSFVMGLVLMNGFPPIVFVRDNIAVPKLVSPSSFLSHTLFDVGPLPTSKVQAK